MRSPFYLIFITVQSADTGKYLLGALFLFYLDLVVIIIWFALVCTEF